MLLATHALVGASAAQKIKNPFLSFPLILALHFLMDLIPHWDLGTDFRKRTKVKNFFLAFLDGLSALLSVFFLFQYQKSFSFLLWLGAGISLLPDFLEAPYIFLDFHLFPSIDHFHSKIAHRKSREVIGGLIPQLIIIGLVIFLL